VSEKDHLKKKKKNKNFTTNVLWV